MPERSLVDAARRPHRGIFITGPDRLELLEDTLRADHFSGSHIITESLGNCRCSSDRKAIRQLTRHARIPANATQVALGHECIHRILDAPAGTGVEPGDIVFVTPGQFNSPHDPETFEPDPEKGVIASMGYSYRYLGGLRRYNAIPSRAIDVVREQGFGRLFNRVPRRPDVSLATLAHAEPFACCHGSMKHMFFTGGGGQLRAGIPPHARIAFLGGTARMAMIKLTILAARPDGELPRRVAITGSKAKLEALSTYALIRGLRERGVEVLLVDRRAPDVVDRLLRHGRYDAVFTNFPSQEVFDQAVELVEQGGNLNNYAGAVDPDIYLRMEIPGVPAFPSHGDEARRQIAAMHHNVAPNDPRRVHGIASRGRVLFLNFSGQRDRLAAYLAALPDGCGAHVEGGEVGALSARFPHLEFAADLPSYTDVFIAGIGSFAADAYTRIELKLARNAAVNLVDGATTIRIRSKHAHYASRHQICGPTVPWSMTNTSEPVSEDIAIQGERPIDFDWLVKGVAGLDHGVEMIRDVNERDPFGSFFVLTQIGDLPYVEVSSEAFRRKAAELRDAGEGDAPAARALEAAAAVLKESGESWSRRAEEAIYREFDVEYPLSE